MMCNMFSKFKCLLCALVLTCATQSPAAGQSDPVKTDTLPVIEVRATRTATPAERSPLAISVLDAGRIRPAQPLLSLAESLPAVPGVFVLNDANYAQDLRIAVRGFGSRAGFGIRGVKILLDGIPESSPDGQAQVDNIDPASISRIEVLRGPSAGLYGNAAGGVISLQSEHIDSSGIEGRTVAGAFGFRQYRLKGAIRKGNTAFGVFLTRNTLEGFRRHAAMQATMAGLKFHWHNQADSSLRLTFLANYTDSPRADDPGGLTASQDSTDRRMAHPANVQFNAGESLRHGRVGVLAEKKLSPNSRIEARIWSLWRDFENRLPFRAGGQVAFRRWAGGGLVQYAYESPWKYAGEKGRIRASTGVEFDRQSDDRRRFDNNNGTRGALNLLQDEIFGSTGIFALCHWQALEWLSISGGARADIVRLAVRDQFSADGDQSGERNFRRVSPWGGAVWRLGSKLNLYANASTNFETPTLIELSNNPQGTGGFAPGLDPQRTLSFETGMRGRSGGRLSWELALFQSRTRGELTPYELPNEVGRIYYQNAGITKRQGIEAAIYYAPASPWLVWGNYAFSGFRFESFRTGVTDYAGKDLPGLPRHLGQASARYSHRSGIMAQLSARYTGRFFADNANAVAIPATAWCAARVAWQRRIGKTRAEVFAGADNLTNANIYNNIRINAAAGRYYEPGAGRSFFMGALWAM